MTIPAYLLDGQWTARAWNPPAAELFVGWLDGEHDRNLMRFIFRSPAAPRLIDAWEDRARRVVAEFRSDFSRRLGEPTLRRLIEELGRPHRLSPVCGASRRCLDAKAASVASSRPLDEFRQSTLVFASHPEAKLVCLTPIDE